MGNACCGERVRGDKSLYDSLEPFNREEHTPLSADVSFVFSCPIILYNWVYL
jgi:hypothetical protein